MPNSTKATTDKGDLLQLALNHNFALKKALDHLLTWRGSPARAAMALPSPVQVCAEVAEK